MPDHRTESRKTNSDSRARRGPIRVLALLPIVMLASGVLVTEATTNAGFSLTGTIWHDANFDGVRQPSEDGAAQIVMLLDGRETISDASGTYSFQDLQPGSYNLELGTQGQIVGATFPDMDLSGSIDIAVNLTASQSVDIGVVYSDDVMQIFGSSWIDGAPVEGATVRAYVGDVDCTIDAQSLLPTDTGPAAFIKSVAPDGLIEGCGGPGADVSFTIDGLPSHQSVQWAGYVAYTVLTAGHPVALYSSAITIMGISSDAIEALINGTSCSAAYGTFGGFFLAVFSAEQRPGCGRAGDEIELIVNGKDALKTLTWHTGHSEINFDDFVDSSYADLTPFATPANPCPPECAAPTGIRPPSTGSAGLKTR
jgi:SdrD B-like domain